jgi:hypothetical protein
MAAELSYLIDFLRKPPRRAPDFKKRLIEKKLPENFKYFRNWGFTNHGTYYRPESDEHWKPFSTS